MLFKTSHLPRITFKAHPRVSLFVNFYQGFNITEFCILYILCIQFEDSEETLVAHKQVLAQMSTVFEGQFYGPMSAHAR